MRRRGPWVRWRIRCNDWGTGGSEIQRSSGLHPISRKGISSSSPLTNVFVLPVLFIYNVKLLVMYLIEKINGKMTMFCFYMYISIWFFLLLIMAETHFSGSTFPFTYLLLTIIMFWYSDKRAWYSTTICLSGKTDFADRKKNGENRLGFNEKGDGRYQTWLKTPWGERQENNDNEDDVVTERQEQKVAGTSGRSERRDLRG